MVLTYTNMMQHADAPLWLQVQQNEVYHDTCTQIVTYTYKTRSSNNKYLSAYTILMSSPSTPHPVEPYKTTISMFLFDLSSDRYQAPTTVCKTWNTSINWVHATKQTPGGNGRADVSWNEPYFASAVVLIHQQSPLSTTNCMSLGGKSLCSCSPLYGCCWRA